MGMGVCGWVRACVCVMCNYVILYMHPPVTCVMCALTDYKLLQITYDSHIRTVQCEVIQLMIALTFQQLTVINDAYCNTIRMQLITD